MNAKNSYTPNYAVIPGDILDEHREAALLTQEELANRLGLSKKHINRMIAGNEPITSETALKLEIVFGLPAHVWIGLESRYREFLAREAETKSLHTEAKWLKEIPHGALANLGWIPKKLGDLETIRALREFFRVASLNHLPKVWEETSAAYRKTEAYRSQQWALLAWLAQAEREAESISCAPFDASSLREALPELKSMSKLPSTEFIQPLIDRCASLGIALVFLPEPKGACVCGATRWLSKDKVLVQLSLRYKTNDHLWVTFFHELGHVLLHGKKQQFIEFYGVNGEKKEEEIEADEFAAKTLIARNEMHRFITNGDFSKLAVEKFANANGIAAGIVVGQLQHQKLIRFNSPLSHLKTSFRWPHETNAA